MVLPGKNGMPKRIAKTEEFPASHPVQVVASKTKAKEKGGRILIALDKGAQISYYNFF
jgi:hypothetical protein